MYWNSSLSKGFILDCKNFSWFYGLLIREGFSHSGFSIEGLFHWFSTSSSNRMSWFYCFIALWYGVCDVEQTTHAFLEQQGRKKSQHKIKGGGLVGAIGITVSKLHEIWQVEGKWHSDPDSWNFAIYSNICFSLITFSLKVRIRSHLIWDVS